jgi:hypothetical protein
MTASSIATPDAPSFAPVTALVESVERGPSAAGRVSQWARKRIRFSAAGLYRAITFWSCSESPARVTWVHRCVITESARARAMLSSQAAMRRCPSVPGIRKPNSSCRWR